MKDFKNNKNKSTFKTPNLNENDSNERKDRSFNDLDPDDLSFKTKFIPLKNNKVNNQDHYKPRGDNNSSFNKNKSDFNKDTKSYTPKNNSNSERPNSGYNKNKSDFNKDTNSYTPKNSSNSERPNSGYNKNKSDFSKDNKPYASKNNFRNGDQPKSDYNRDKKPYSPRNTSNSDQTNLGNNKTRPFNNKERFNNSKNFNNDLPENEKKKFKLSYDPEVKLSTKGFKPKVEKSQRKRIPNPIKTPLVEGEIRLNKFIAQSGICSRREADDLIKKGVVSVNDTIVKEMGFKVKPNDVVKHEGKRILAEPFVYILMNKPKDFITTTEDEKDRKTVIDLLADKVSERVFPIGRLDRNTTGVLLITNDGELTQILTHPSFEIKKVYHAVLDKKMIAKDLDKLVEGFELEDGFVHADSVAYVETEDKRHIGIEIHSGKNHIVRRMFAHLGYEVEKLDRVSFGTFTKKDLPRGKWRHFTTYEIANILKIKEKSLK